MIKTNGKGYKEQKEGGSMVKYEEGSPDWKALEEEAISLLSQYLQIDTTNPPGNEILAARFFKSIFDREGIESQIFESAPGRGNIYVCLKGDGSKKPIILLNHMDVVPADRRFWSMEPFSGVIQDGYLWGRGAIDMKGMGILELMTVLILKRWEVPLKGDVIFLGTADEEAGGRYGAGYMIDQHFDLIRGAGVVLNEFGWIYVREGKVEHYGVAVSEKTPFWLRLTAVSTPGHGSMPRADSSVNKLIEALHRIIQYQTPIKVVPDVQSFYADLADFAPGPFREKLKDLKSALQDPAFVAQFTRNLRSNAEIRNTISVTMLEGSNKVNVIPPEASAQIDVRLLPGENPAAFLEEIRKVIQDDSIRIEPILAFTPTTASPADSEFIQVIREIAKEYHPSAVVTRPLLVGFTDSHYFREKGIPSYGFVPFKLSDQDLALFHGNDERISLENVRLGTRMLYEIVKKLVVE